MLFTLYRLGVSLCVKLTLITGHLNSPLSLVEFAATHV